MSAVATNQAIPHIASTTYKPIAELESNLAATSNSSSSSSSEVELHEATLDADPNQPPPRSLVKPILNKARLSPGMLVKLKNLNRRKSQSNERNVDKVTTDDKLEASASELNTFVQHNTISPTLNTIEISNLIKRNETLNVAQPVPTTINSNDDLVTTLRSL